MFESEAGGGSELKRRVHLKGGGGRGKDKCVSKEMMKRQFCTLGEGGWKDESVKDEGLKRRVSKPGGGGGGKDGGKGTDTRVC